MERLTTQGKQVAVTCTTGMATTQFKMFHASTIHHWAGLQDGRHTKEKLVRMFEGSDKYAKLLSEIRRTEVLFIDEIGMLSSKQFSVVEYVCRNVRQIDLLFGGLQLIVSGCFKQLPPVPSQIANDPGEYVFLNEEFQIMFPHHVQLTSVLRQEEEDLIKAVNELCNGTPSLETEKMIQDLDRPIGREGEDGVLTMLCGTNLDVDYVNQDKLDSLQGEECVYKATDLGDIKLLRKCHAPKVLKLKIGAPVTLLQNLDVSIGLVNGLVGKVIELKTNGPKVEFNSKAYDISIQKFIVYSGHNLQLTAERQQYPLKLAFALTVHRSIGLTIPFLEVDCFSFFQAGQMGVAVGRAVNKRGLRIINYSPESANLKHPPEVYEFYRSWHNITPVEDMSCCQVPVNSLSPDASTSYSGDMPDEPDIHFNINEVSDYGDCPLLFKDLAQATFTQDTPEALKLSKIIKGLEENPQITAFINFIWNICCHVYFSSIGTRKTSKSQRWQKMMSNIHMFSGSVEYITKVKALFGPDLPDDGYRVCSRIVLYLLKLLAEKDASKIIHQQEASHTARLEEETMTAPIEAKVRYLAGACVAKIRWRLQEHLKAKLTSSQPTMQRKYIRDQLTLLSQLQKSEAEIVTTTEHPQSLEEITHKQGRSHGLTHVGDTTYDFFCSLFKAVKQKLRPQELQLHLSTIHTTVRQTVRENENLLDQWMKLFLISQDEERKEMEMTLVISLYHAVTDHYIKIILSDTLILF